MPDHAIAGIHIMAAIATALALAIVGALILIRSSRRDWPLFALCLVLELPISWLLFEPVRLPLNAWIQGLPLGRLGQMALLSLTAPIVEEPAKVWPLLLTLALPALAGRVTRDNAVRVGLALGLGFGIGEIWMLAGPIAADPTYGPLPWYIFQGFLIERVPVAALHGAMAAITLWFWVRGKWWGILLAMLVHWLLNLPIPLAILGVFGSDPTVQATISLAWVYLAAVILGLLVVFLLHGRKGLSKLAGGTHSCPGCGETYDAPLVGLNLVTKRYERCPHCRRWHFVRAFGSSAGSSGKP